MKQKHAALPHEQIKLLQSKGIEISDVDSAIKYLEQIDYYRFKGYLAPFKTLNGYEELTFERIKKIIQFDQKLRWWIFQYLEQIEISLRAIIVKTLAYKDKCDGLSYHNLKYFNDQSAHKKIMDEVNANIERSKDEHSIMHYINKYQGKMPIWVIIETMTFGGLSMFFQNMQTPYRRAVAEPFEIHFRGLLSSLRLLSYARNKCAHHNRIYARRFETYPMQKKWYNKKGIPHDNMLLYPVLHVMKDLTLDNQSWNGHLLELNSVIEYFDVYIKLEEHMGFPSDWYDQLLIKD